MKYTDLSCIRCRKAFSPGLFGWENAPPDGGLLFISHGNYGSRIYDQQAGSSNYLLVIICDQCILAEAARQNVMQCLPVQVITEDAREPWDPSEALGMLEMPEGGG